VFVTLLHVIVGLTGLLLFYIGLFLNETEEGQLQSRLEDLWIRVDDLQSQAISRQAALLQQVSKLTSEALVWLFGQKLFSIKRLASCFCFALASNALSIVLSGSGDILEGIKPALLILSLLLLLAGFFRWLRYFGFVMLIVGVYGVLTGAAGFHETPAEIVYSLIVNLISVASVVGFIAITRWSLQRAARLSRTAAILALILLNVAIGFALISPTLFSATHHYSIAMTSKRVGGVFSRPHAGLVLLYAVAQVNLFTAIVAFTIVFVLFAALAHRIVWPIMARPLYAAHQHGIIRQHKLLIGLGILCWTLAWPHNVVVKALARVIHAGG
jgi:hypothetical protein